jgi:hypothetical protein
MRWYRNRRRNWRRARCRLVRPRSWRRRSGKRSNPNRCTHCPGSTCCPWFRRWCSECWWKSRWPWTWQSRSRSRNSRCFPGCTCCRNSMDCRPARRSHKGRWRTSRCRRPTWRRGTSWWAKCWCCRSRAGQPRRKPGTCSSCTEDWDPCRYFPRSRDRRGHRRWYRFPRWSSYCPRKPGRSSRTACRPAWPRRGSTADPTGRRRTDHRCMCRS